MNQGKHARVAREVDSPGTARSRSLALSSFGETYCSSSNVRVGRFLLILRKTCRNASQQGRLAPLKGKPTHLVVQVPGVVEVLDLAVLAVPPARFASVGEISTERLREGDLAQRFRTLRKKRVSAHLSEHSPGSTPSRACRAEVRGSQTWRRCCGRRKRGGTLPRDPRATARARGWRRG